MADTARASEYPGKVETAAEFGPLLQRSSILIVDDEPGMRNFLKRTLQARCARVDEAADVAHAAALIDENRYDIVILDNIMPGKNGLEWLEEQRAIGFFSDVILMTAYADLETAIQALRAGAMDFVLKPFRSNQILNAISRCLERRSLQRENFVLRHELQAASDHLLLRDRLIGNSPGIQSVRSTIARVAPLPTSVLICGPSGSGKEVAARSLHALSDRATKSFVPVNCAAIPSEMIEAELFGHVRGAFTGATDGREGLFLHAHGGTLFLDEIGELPLQTQSKLLRALEDRKVRPVGSEREASVDLRFVFATNADLESLVAEGRFRADLYYRINVMRIDMPRLKDRGDDVIELAELFLQKLALQLGTPKLALTEDARQSFRSYGWPGNVRELRNLIERSLILGQFPKIRPSPVLYDADAGDTMDDLERRHILRTLEECDGNRSEAARRLGISRKTVERKLAQWERG
ncbi:sigma-54-dependent Fis family transcriptional regulator [Stappia sp. F7233]|uniref:Sigma-54-dependent Fis family transcriptional regulator n=1 Tax=Stappia albiluteola TaxID=2758565 RepID=A0A839A8L6_9HYPH|nr:sigma-54 dependent transcriptional regulator [Stappia albiluteola]MBA5775671.1 sigma-54-dependent Fis family transcriptional regulator [Stappia albiluteola]